MKNTKEIKAILTAIHCINYVNGNRDTDIYNLIEYAFQRCFGGTGNLVILTCIGQTKESLMPAIQELLNQETQYAEFMRKQGE